jgi:chromosomal replication initiation ATPase DnaA
MARRLLASSWRHFARANTSNSSINVGYGQLGLVSARIHTVHVNSNPASERVHHGRRWTSTAAARLVDEEPTEPDQFAPTTISSSKSTTSTRDSQQNNPELDAHITDLKRKYDLPNFLRPYQVEVIHACMSALARGVNRIGVSSPTGSGKTVML